MKLFIEENKFLLRNRRQFLKLNKELHSFTGSQFIQMFTVLISAW